MNELEIIKMPEIEFKGYEEIKKQLEEDVAKYQNYLVTEDTLKDDTALRTELNKKAKAIDEKRKEIEKLVSAPIKEFKSKCDELKNLYTNVSEKIDIQIKKFEYEIKEKKRKEVLKLIDKLVVEKELKDKYKTQIPFDERYLNKTYKLADIEKDLITNIDILLEKQNEENKNIDAIKKHVELVNQNTKIKLDVDDFIHKLDYMDFQEIILQISASSKRIEMQEKKLSESSEDSIAKTTSIPKVEVRENEPTYDFILKITGTKNQLLELKEYMKMNSIKFEKIED